MILLLFFQNYPKNYHSGPIQPIVQFRIPSVILIPVMAGRIIGHHNPLFPPKLKEDMMLI